MKNEKPFAVGVVINAQSDIHSNEELGQLGCKKAEEK